VVAELFLISETVAFVLKEYLNCFYLHGYGALSYALYTEDYVYDLYTVTDEMIVEEDSSYSYPV
jgi:hypothetical protein